MSSDWRTGPDSLLDLRGHHRRNRRLRCGSCRAAASAGGAARPAPGPASRHHLVPVRRAKDRLRARPPVSRCRLGTRRAGSRPAPRVRTEEPRGDLDPDRCRSEDDTR